jgi:hypothetical protein
MASSVFSESILIHVGNQKIAHRNASVSHGVTIRRLTETASIVAVQLPDRTSRVNSKAFQQPQSKFDCKLQQ